MKCADLVLQSSMLLLPSLVELHLKKSSRYSILFLRQLCFKFMKNEIT